MARMAASPGKSDEADVIRFDVLPDDVLLDIFYFYVNTPPYYNKEADEWQTLAHVCQQWRRVVFLSPRRLNLRLCCTLGRRMRDTLDIWPAFPLVVKSEVYSTSRIDNIIAALSHNNRVCEISLWDLADWQLQDVLATMQVPFPELTVLELSSQDVSAPVIFDRFLGGSVKSLRRLVMDRIPFPGLPNLLLSATQVAVLCLTEIPRSGYFSPKAMVASLSALSSLEILRLKFTYYLFPPDRETRRPPPQKCFILPALDYFAFRGNPQYLEDLLSGIDAPQLDRLHVEFFNPIFGCPQLEQFINRSLKHINRDKVHLQIESWASRLLFGISQVSITCEGDWRLPSVIQICSSSIFSTVEDLYIERIHPRLAWTNTIENTLWLQLLLPFIAVKNLYLCEGFAPGIAATLQELIGHRMTGVMPSLRNIFVEEPARGPFKKNIEQFVVARQLSGHPVTISNWGNDEDSDMESM